MSQIVQTNSEYDNKELIFETNSDGYIIDNNGIEIICQICKEAININIHKYIIIQGKVYNVKSLLNYILYEFNKEKQIPRIPHNIREPITEEILQNINNKISNKSEIIIEIINLLKFPKKTQEYLLALEEEQRKIILDFEDYKIKILIKLSEDDVDLLFKQYHYLLNNDISEEVIKDAVKKCYKSLLFVPTYKITKEMFNLANKKDAIPLKYIEFQNKKEPSDKMTKEITNLSVRNGYKKLKLNY
jgi:hypothetical protein